MQPCPKNQTNKQINTPTHTHKTKPKTRKQTTNKQITLKKKKRTQSKRIQIFQLLWLYLYCESTAKVRPQYRAHKERQQDSHLSYTNVNV